MKRVRPEILFRFLLAFMALTLVLHVAVADEGMWLYNHPPAKQVLERYGFSLTPPWLDHLQKASVRFGAGGSAEFVSEEGLVLSNHHVGARAVQRLSSPQHNYIRDGFYARTRAEELPCSGVELNVLTSIEDVTARVNAAVKPGTSDEAAFQARRAVSALIENESTRQTGLRSEVITLFQGAQYHLYRFKKYTDVRLVFAPEEQIAFYGGDPDNFEYPRYDLDICVFRAYENGQPARVENFLKWSKVGPAENELVFVSGHPGRTDRLRTMAELEYLRDVDYPRSLQRLKRIEVLLTSWSARNPENARRARTDLFSSRNGRKRRDGALSGLLDPKLMAAKQSAEQQLRAAVAANPALKDASGAWDRIAQAQQSIAQHSLEDDLLERGNGFYTPLFQYARDLLRADQEGAKPDSERLEEYRESARASFEHRLFAEQPFYPDFEALKLDDSLTWLAETLGWNHPVVQKVLAGKSPRERASELVRGTRLSSASVRRQLYSGGSGALTNAIDPMIELARQVDPEARRARKAVEVQREAIRQAHAQIERARYTLGGEHNYPDATGSLRLAFGAVRGYEQQGQPIPFETTFTGLYARAEEQKLRSPFDLPARWVAGRGKLNLATPLNFVCTADIIGGNSGSPVVNRAGELVGLIFDGNIQSLTADFLYSDVQCRAVAVHCGGIIEALRKVYDAAALADELVGEQ
jgi:hypothetical protein